MINEAVELKSYATNILRKFCFDSNVIEDAIQESYIKVIRKGHTFKGTSSFRVWYVAIVINCLRNMQNKSRRYILTDRVFEDSYENKITDHKLTKKLEKELNKLPNKQKIAVEHKYLKDMNRNEMARTLGWNPESAHTNYRLGLLKLKKAFEPELKL